MLHLLDFVSNSFLQGLEMFLCLFSEEKEGGALRYTKR